jgi:aminomethyltransferase
MRRELEPYCQEISLSETLKRTCLYDAHADSGAKFVPFAGYEMPIQYREGIMAEHNWTRENAGLFDVSHMGQCFIKTDDFDATAIALEKIFPCDIRGLEKGQIRYTQLLNADGGIIDDVMITRSHDHYNPNGLELVFNASRAEVDLQWVVDHLPPGIRLGRLRNRSLIALQGPRAEEVFTRTYCPEAKALKFMQQNYFTTSLGFSVNVWRSGYTGEDGFEISLEDKHAPGFWTLLSFVEGVKVAGLAARDSLRLEAGLCLYGHDIDETTSPNEAGLMWSIPKRRREEGGFMGAARVQAEIQNGVKRLRVGIKPDGRAPAREGTVIQNAEGREIGKVTSGGFGPTVGGPVAMGYVETAFSAVGTPLHLIVRGNALPASVVKLPFVPNRFKR